MNEFQEQANNKINSKRLSKSPISRCSRVTKALLNDEEYVIDVHAHFFDIKCINKAYFLLRMLKDFIGLKSTDQTLVKYSETELYSQIRNNDLGWEKRLELQLEDPIIGLKSTPDGKKGVIDIIKTTKFLKFKKMRDVYDYYISNFSLASTFGLDESKVIVTALMMDLELGWSTKIRKSISEQLEELLELAERKPVLPFLFCDPRRAELNGEDQNLYSIFNKAFCEDKSFFGVKIYPALGYDPSDYRLWPIYKICEEFKIPVLSHCGGESISTDNRVLKIYEGDKLVELKAKNRKEMAYILNDPKRWALILKKFPKLKLNLAHFGGYETWSSSVKVDDKIDPQHRKEYIFKLMKKYNNVYADFSYNIVEEDLTDNLKNRLVLDDLVRERTLFGTDFWVVNKEGNLQTEQTEFLNSISNGYEELDLKNVVCKYNPYNYLFK